MSTVIAGTQKKPLASAVRFLNEVWAELKKVQWPTSEELKAFTVIVIIALIAVGAYVGSLDAVMARISNWVFDLKPQ